MFFCCFFCSYDEDRCSERFRLGSVAFFGAAARYDFGILLSSHQHGGKDFSFRGALAREVRAKDLWTHRQLDDAMSDYGRLWREPKHRPRVSCGWWLSGPKKDGIARGDTY